MTNGDEEPLRRLEHGHADTRWWLGRIDRDVADLGGRLHRVQDTLTDHTRILSEHARILGEQSRVLGEHTGRLDSIDMQMRSLTRMVGEVLCHVRGDHPNGHQSTDTDDREDGGD